MVYNEEGSNQIEGVTTLVLTNATLSGHVKADVLLLESDERYAKFSFRFFHPTEFVITNLYRDQLTRNGHPEWVYDAILPAIHPDTTLILNADDPLSSCFARDHQAVKWFGLDRCPSDSDAPTGVYHDGTYCPVCHAPMTYDYVHYNHIGAYRCSACGHAKPATDFTATALDLGRGTLTLDHAVEIQLAFRSIYNVYNILAAYAACRCAGIPAETVGRVVSNYILKNGRMQTFTLGGHHGTLLTSKHENSIAYDTNLRPAETVGRVVSNYILKNGRMQTFTLGGHHGTLLTSKHENSIAYDTNLRYIAASRPECAVLVVVDAVSRKYFTSETSWLWDIDFDQLNAPQVKRVVLSGRYCNDLAERFSFTDIPQERIEVHESIPEACQALAETGSEDLYVVTCFSDRDKVLAHVKKEA